MAVKLGLQIPKFSLRDGAGALFSKVAEQAREADATGFDAVFVMDHFYQLPSMGEPDEPMLEAYTTLGALAAVTKHVQLGTLVTGNTYRNPALLAKQITTLDIISQGRAILGIGTGWYELEHRQLGFEFGSFTDRFNRLDEALQIIVPMIEGKRPTFSGRWYRAEGAVAEPRLRDHIPLLIGGSGVNKTFPLAARHFDHLNIIAPHAQLATKLAVLRDRCEQAGRDPATLETSVFVLPVSGQDEVEKYPEGLRGQCVIGEPDAVAEQVKSNVLDVGVDGVIVIASDYTPGAVAELGAALSPLLHG